MKMNRRFVLPMLAVAALVLAIPSLLNAQPGPHGFGGRHGMRHHGFGGPHGEGGPGHDGPLGSRMVMFMLHGLDLSDAQREQIDGILEQEQEGVEAKHEALREAHQSLHTLALAETYDAAAVKGAAETVGRLMGEMAENRARIGHSILQLLTPEQRDKLEARHERMMTRREARRDH